MVEDRVCGLVDQCRTGKPSGQGQVSRLRVAKLVHAQRLDGRPAGPGRPDARDDAPTYGACRSRRKIR
jgi:hypothetical protein